MSPQVKRNRPDATDATKAECRTKEPAVAGTYFVAGPNVRVARATGGVATGVTGGPFHAKAMGTPMTACGLPTWSWPKLWDIPFARSPQPVCPECFDTLYRTVRRPA